jgi:aerobic carbon-monoxide dehydrogenase medium subunit
MVPFEYHAATSIDEAVALLNAHPDARLVAGGMTLIPAMKMRLSTPPQLINVASVPELHGARIGNGMLSLGATTRHAEVAEAAEVRRLIPALADLAGGIGDPQVRNRGTIGGSIANNDPAADYPAALLALEATVFTNRRSIPADAFFTAMFETALEPGEVITEVRFPVPRSAIYCKFRSLASRFALVGVFLARTNSGVRVAVTGAASCVFRATAIESALQERFSVETVDRLRMSSDGFNSDMNGDAEYRAHLVMVLTRRAVASLSAAAGGQ